MARKNPKDDSFFPTSKPNKETKRQKRPRDKNLPPSLESISLETAPSVSPPRLPRPKPLPPPSLPELSLPELPLEGLTPSLPLPPPSPTLPSLTPPSSPPPPQPPPPPPSSSPPSQSPRPLSLQPQPLPSLQSNNSTPSTPPWQSALSNDSTPGTSGKLPPMELGLRSYYGVIHDGNSRAESSASSGSSSGDHLGKYLGYILAGVFAIALVAVALLFIFTFKRKKTKGEGNGAPYMPPLFNFYIKSGANGHYYVQQQPGHLPSPANINAIGNVSTKNLGASLDSSKPKSAQIFFTYDMVMEITNGFCSQNFIGEGGFGCVHKGWLPDGKAVAVKQLKAGSGQGDREFTAEVEIISRVHHRHLVSLVGYCISEQQRVLIYEYIPNGTLHHHLHGSGIPVLDWAKRLKIAIGAAKGLAYLHEDCSQKIIHRDIKSANILLDDAYEAQVADFGLARLSDAANTHVSTRVMGTFGYMAPEYATSGKLTDRSDVFSFGVVLLELVTGRKPVDETQPLGDESLVEWARPLLLRSIQTQDFSELIDPRLNKHFVKSEMFRMIEVATACIRHSAPRRPRMVQVVRALDSVDEISDLSNGVKYGESMVYDSGQYDKDIMLFRRSDNGSYTDSDFDMYSRKCSFSRDTSRGTQHACYSSEPKSRAFDR